MNGSYFLRSTKNKYTTQILTGGALIVARGVIASAMGAAAVAPASATEFVVVAVVARASAVAESSTHEPSAKSLNRKPRTPSSYRERYAVLPVWPGAVDENSTLLAGALYADLHSLCALTQKFDMSTHLGAESVSAPAPSFDRVAVPAAPSSTSFEADGKAARRPMLSREAIACWRAQAETRRGESGSPGAHTQGRQERAARTALHSTPVPKKWAAFRVKAGKTKK